jgi:hypothetical protein
MSAMTRHADPGWSGMARIIVRGSGRVERYRVAMASPKELIEIDGREVSISNPQKVYFPDAGYTKLDVVRYYQAVAGGALTGIRGRPMALKRFVDGITKEPFFQKRAPDNTPDWIRTAEAHISVRPDRGRDRRGRDRGPAVDRQPRLHRPQPAPRSGPTTWITPTSCGWTSTPVPGIEWPQIRDVAMVCQEALEAVGLVGWPKTSGSRGIHINVRIERRWTYPEVRRAALALARDVERRAPDLATSKWWKEERHGVFLDYNQNAKDRTGRVGVLDPAAARCPGVDTVVVGRGPDRRGRGVHDRDGAEAVRRDRRPGRRHRRRVGSLEALLELSAQHEREGEGDAPWPPNYAKQAGEPPGSSRRGRAARPSEYEPGRGCGRWSAARGPRPSGRPRSPRATRTRACRPSGRARARPRPAGARRTCRSSRSRGRRRRPKPSRAGALEGAPSGRRRPPRAGRRAGRTGCAAARPSGTASGSTSSHVPEPTARPRNHSTPTTTRGPATSGPTGQASSSVPHARRRRPTDGAARLRGVLERAAAGWAAGDAAAVGDCFAADVRYLDPYRYRFDRREDLLPFFEPPPDGHHVTWHTTIWDDATQTGAVEYTYEGHHRYHGTAIVRLDADGRIALWREWQHLDDELDWDARLEGPAP